MTTESDPSQAAPQSPAPADPTARPAPLAAFKAKAAAAQPGQPSDPTPGQVGADSDQGERAPAEEGAAHEATAHEATAQESPAQPQEVAPPSASLPVQRAGQRAIVPSKRHKLSSDLEAEFAAAFGDSSSMDALLGVDGKVADESIEFDTRHTGTVVRIHGDHVFFSLGTRSEGVASLRQFDEPPAPGESREVVVTGRNREDGLYELAIPGATVSVSDWADVTEGTVVEARVTGSNTGGLECQVNSIRAFIPTSQISVYRVENLADFVDQKLACVVVEANEQRGNLVLSHRAVLEREQEKAREEFLANVEPGQTCDGVVRSLRDFGAFVELAAGVDGLVHISKLSWDRVNHPSEVLEEGQKIKVKVENVDPQTGRIGLSFRDTLDDPWDSIEATFPANSIVPGVVTRVANFGAFVKLAPGIEGLVHVSELAHYRVKNVSSVAAEGQEVQVKVLSIDPENQRISLSIKGTELAPEAEKADEPDEESADEAPRQPLVKKRLGELKGGTGRSSGGDQFGLKW